ncbi:MAG: hypothetical protein HND58_17200 [Planctomycetota bacterium]|nr:MAG: hypothetical protein HND58_17200 [Planctomycetota bacterium]
MADGGLGVPEELFGLRGVEVVEEQAAGDDIESLVERLVHRVVAEEVHAHVVAVCTHLCV